MADKLTLDAEKTEARKGAVRPGARKGRVSAVIYGSQQQPLSIHLEEKALIKALSTGHFMNTVVMIDGVGEAIRTLPKDVQFHPVTDRPLHVDFLRIGEHVTVHVDVPVVFTDEEQSPGIKRGGVLNVVVHHVGLTSDAAEIPSEIVVSLAGAEIGYAIRASELILPPGCSLSDEDPNGIIAIVVLPSALTAEAGREPSDGETSESSAEVNVVLHEAKQFEVSKLGIDARQEVHIAKHIDTLAVTQSGELQNNNGLQLDISQDLFLAAASDAVLSSFQEKLGSPSDHLQHIRNLVESAVESAHVQ